MSIELVSQPDDDGLRWTFGTAIILNRQEHIDQIASEAGVGLLGIVAAQAVIQNQGVLTRLITNERVYLVDLSVADYKRHSPGGNDVSQSDLYWALAGWD